MGTPANSGGGLGGHGMLIIKMPAIFVTLLFLCGGEMIASTAISMSDVTGLDPPLKSPPLREQSSLANKHLQVQHHTTDTIRTISFETEANRQRGERLLVI